MNNFVCICFVLTRIVDKLYRVCRIYIDVLSKRKIGKVHENERMNGGEEKLKINQKREWELLEDGGNIIVGEKQL